METGEKNARWYVYALIDPRDGAVFYIGKGSGARMHQHEKYAANERAPHSKKINKIREIVADGQFVEKQICAQFWDEQAAYDHETDWIEEIGLANLTNVLPGGQKAWDRRREARRATRLKEKPAKSLSEMLASGTHDLLSRFAEWFRADGHKGQKFAFTALKPGFKIHAALSDYMYNKYLPYFWGQIQKDESALEVFEKKMRPYGIEVQYAGA